MELQKFRHYLICQDSGGQTLELLRDAREVVCVAFDTKREFLVELRILSEEEANRSRMAEVEAGLRRVRHPNVQVLFDFGEDEGTPYCVTEFVDGEGLREYLERVGPLPEAMAVRLTGHVLRGLRALRNSPAALRAADLGRARISLDSPFESGLRVKLAGWRFGGGASQQVGADAAALLVSAASGRRVHASELPDAIERLGLSRGAAEFARLLCRPGPSNGSLRESDLEGWVEAADACEESMRDSLSAPAAEYLEHRLHPLLPLRTEFRSGSDLAHHLGDGYRVSSDVFSAATPYEFDAFDPDIGEPVRLQLLPPPRLAGLTMAQRIRAAMSEVDEDRCPNLLRPTAFWGDPGGDFFAEERCGAGTLEAALTRRGGRLEPAEALSVLEQVDRGLEQASRAGLDVWGLSAGCVHLSPGGNGRDALTDLRRCRIKLRAHPTALNLMQPVRCFSSDIVPPRASCREIENTCFARFAASLAGRVENPVVRTAFERLITENWDRWEGSGAGARGAEVRRRFLREAAALAGGDAAASGSAGSESNAGAAQAASLPSALEVWDDGAPSTAHEPAEDERSTSPGLAEALFGFDDTEEDDGFNPVARAMRRRERGEFDDPDDAEDDFDDDAVFASSDSPEVRRYLRRRAIRAVLRITLFILLAAGALAAAIAHFAGTAFWLRE